MREFRVHGSWGCLVRVGCRFLPGLGPRRCSKVTSSTRYHYSPGHTCSGVGSDSNRGCAASGMGEQECRLTLPSRGSSKGYRPRPPLMSNVRRHKQPFPMLPLYKAILAPALLLQGTHLRKTALRLPEADGDRSGLVEVKGTEPLRLLFVGDSPVPVLEWIGSTKPSRSKLPSASRRRYATASGGNSSPSQERILVKRSNLSKHIPLHRPTS